MQPAATELSPSRPPAAEREPGDLSLSPEERDRLLDRVALEVTRRGLETPAILALELHRPLPFLAQQFTVLCQPMLAPLVGWGTLDNLIRLLDDPRNLDRLLNRIEEQASLRDAGPVTAGDGAHE